MATIRYNIEIDQNGNANVTQDVLLIGPSDQIVFFSSGQNVQAGQSVAVRFPTHSPFTGGAGPQTNKAFKIQSDGTAYAVQKSNHSDGESRIVPGFGPKPRLTFHFDCGQVDNTGKFTPWAAGGGDMPGGGDGN